MRLNRDILSRSLIVIFGVCIPDAAFVLSCVLAPSSRAAAPWGVLSFLLQTKIVLLPLLPIGNYGLLVSHNAIRNKRTLSKREILCVVIGFLTSVCVTGALFLYDNGLILLHTIPQTFLHLPGVFSLRSPIPLSTLPLSIIAIVFFFSLLLVPYVIPLWYGLLLYTLHKNNQISDVPAVIGNGVLTLSPFLVASLLWAQKMYGSMPEQSRNCFIATASMKGTCWNSPKRTFLVGSVLVSRQVVYGKAFEFFLAERAPLLLYTLRYFYNIHAPAAAQHIARRSWSANMAYIALKPIEYFARTVLFFT